MKKTSRRTILKAGGAGIASLAFPFPSGFYRGAFAGESERPTLVVIYLRGGMDALNVVIPYRSKRYYDLRPTLGIAPDKVVALDKKFGLHPALGALKPFFEQGRVTPIVNVGSPHPTRSHFDAQDFMEYAAPGLRTVRDGWLNRYLTRTGGAQEKRARDDTLRALAMQGLLPRSLRGKFPVLAVPDRRVLQDKKTLEIFGELYDGAGDMGTRNGVLQTGRMTARTLERFEKILAKAEVAKTSPYPRGALGAKLKAIAQVIRSGEGLEVAALDINGWDTHANQGAGSGAMPRLMKGLADGLAAFMTDLGEHLDRTIVVTMTEFGRTCKENGNFGTDHGHGGVMFVMGGKVKGGQVLGKWAGIEEKSMYQGRDLKVTTDFRDVFGEILKNHFRFKPPRGFFPDYRHGAVRGLFA